jgi:hypothetical protein
LHEYYPKRQSLAEINQQQLEQVAAKLNGRVRRSTG